MIDSSHSKSFLTGIRGGRASYIQSLMIDGGHNKFSLELEEVEHYFFQSLMIDSSHGKSFLTGIRGCGASPLQSIMIDSCHSKSFLTGIRWGCVSSLQRLMTQTAVIVNPFLLELEGEGRHHLATEPSLVVSLVVLPAHL